MSAANLGRRSFLAALLGAPLSAALGRRPYGGTLRIALPLSLGALDPHAVGDAASALLSAAIADPLYAWDASGKPYPALAASLPSSVPGGARVDLRPGLVTGAGRRLDGKDVAFSIERARRGAAGPLFAGLAAPRAVRGSPLAVLIPGADPVAVANALAAPATAMLPRGFSPEAPDGTGAFRATRTPAGFALARNERAARGPAFLDGIEIRHAADLAGALRAFETGESDVGWLGAGLHRGRSGALPLHGPALGFLVLRSGPEAGSWGAPGVVARLVEAIAKDRFAHLALVLPGGETGAAWGGPPVDVLVDGGSPYLTEIARAIAAELSRPGHEIRPVGLPLRELRSRIAGGRYALAVDVVRRLGPTPRSDVLSLLAAVDPRLAEKPPLGADVRSLGRTLPMVVLGELAVKGSMAPGFRGLAEWDLGAVFRGA